MERNEACWCGSGKKYKKCHMAMDEKLMILEEQATLFLHGTLSKHPLK